jgi:hypothetical protein
VAKGEPSQADRDLAAAVSRLGVEVSPRQVERWREQGVLQPPERHGKGPPLGSFAVYKPGAVEHAADIARQLEIQGRLNDAALVVFLHGFPVKERAVRAAYRTIYAEIGRFLNPGRLGDPTEVAARAAQAFSRRAARSSTAKAWKKRLKASGDAEAFSYVLSDLLWFFLGGGEEGGELSHDVLKTVGVSEVVDGLPEEDRDKFHELTRRLSLSALERVAIETHFQDLVSARDALSVMRMLTNGDGGASDSQEWALAVVGIPAVHLEGVLVGSAVAEGIARLREASEEI